MTERVRLVSIVKFKDNEDVDGTVRYDDDGDLEIETYSGTIYIKADDVLPFLAAVQTLAPPKKEAAKPTTRSTRK